MIKRIILFVLLISLTFSFVGEKSLSFAQEQQGRITIIVKDLDYESFNEPRPMINSVNVPLKTSFYIRLEVPSDPTDRISPLKVTIQLQPEGQDPYYILQRLKYSPGYIGKLTQDGNILTIFIDTTVELLPSTKYNIIITAASSKGNILTEEDGTYSFTTEAKNEVNELNYSLDLNSKTDVDWEGPFINGVIRPGLATSGEMGSGRFDLMFSEEMQKEYPNAWSYFRHEISAFDHYDNSWLYNRNAPNIVREKETRRIKAIKDTEDGVLLSIEDFFGHEQYGIESNRPLEGDYKEGDEILIADGYNSARANIISVDDINRTVLVSKFTHPEGGWKIDYLTPLPTEERVGAPGLFPNGGTYLRKFNPSGTPVYFWDRYDLVMEEMVIKYGRNLMINISDASGDISLDGYSSTTAKDYVQFHKVTYDMATHLIEKFGDISLDWTWDILGEPDLMGSFWRVKDWFELQRFYDYAVDAILRAYEDKGYDSNEVFIGGLELGAIFGSTWLKADDFLAHCSPTAKKHSSDTLDYNAAYADPRLDGKRSRRVEELCAANNGKGTPLDFVSVHCYNNSKGAADKQIRVKEIALEIDPVYYEKLWVGNHESVPTWNKFKDPGASHWTLGNGYFPTWAADLINRRLQKAALDSRYANGQTMLCLLGYSAPNFTFLNDTVAMITINDNDQGRTEFIAKPIYHFVNLLSTMNTSYWVFPEEMIGGHNVSGFASKGDNDVRMVLYTHNMDDTQSRSDAQFQANVHVKGLDKKEVMVTEYQFDKQNNTYYPFAVENLKKTSFTEEEFNELKELSTLKATNRTIYIVSDDGTINLKLPIAANGANFVVIGEPYDYEETPSESPAETPNNTPEPTPSVTPGETPLESPDDTVDETGIPNETQNDEPSPVAPKTGDFGLKYILMLMLMSTVFLLYYNKKIFNFHKRS